MPEVIDLGTAKLRATLRHASSPSGIGASVWFDETAPGRGGVVLRVIVTDTSNDHAAIRVGLPRARSLKPELVERRVERYAARFPLHTRLADLLEAHGDEPLRFPEPRLDEAA